MFNQNDIYYETRNDDNRTLLLEKAKYVNAIRFNEVIGYVSPEFFKILREKLSDTFNFLQEDEKIQKAREVSEVSKVLEIKETVEIPEKEIETSAPSETSKTSESLEDSKDEKEEHSNTERVLLESLGFAFEKLDSSSSKTVEEKIDTFLSDIGMPKSKKMIRESFIIACYIANIKAINYTSVIRELRKVHTRSNVVTIKEILQESFKIWIEQYPEIKEKCPKISLMSLLKLFAKKMI